MSKKDKNISVNPEVLDDEEGYFSSHVDSFGALVWKRFRHHKLAVIGTIMLLVLILSAVLADVIAPFPPTETHREDVPNGLPLAPNSKYIFGTDKYGRDYFSRCLYGGRISLAVGFVAQTISLVIGLPLGCIAGYYGGVADMIIMRLCEFLSCIPTFFLILTVSATLPTPSIFYVMLIIGIFGWMGITRQIRAQFLTLRQQDFVQAAVSLGLKDSVVVFRHILPNALTPVIINVTMGLANAIMTESSLSYLGLGVQEPNASWGSMLKFAQEFLRTGPWLCIFPGALIALTTLALNFMGDGLRDAFDPRSHK